MVALAHEVVVAARTVIEHRAVDYISRAFGDESPGLVALVAEGSLCARVAAVLFYDQVPVMPVREWRFLLRVAAEHRRELESADSLSERERELLSACVAVAGSGVLAAQL